MNYTYLRPNQVTSRELSTVNFEIGRPRKDPLDISLSWHFSVLMLALQGETARAWEIVRTWARRSTSFMGISWVSVI